MNAKLMMMLLARAGFMAEAGEGGDAGAGAPAAAADGAAPAATEPAAAEPQADGKVPITQQDTLLTGKVEGDGDAAKKDGEQQDGDKPQEPEGAPEAYGDFEVPEGFELDAEVMGEFQAVAKELNLSQAQAQGLVNLQNQLMQKVEAARSEMLESALTEQRNRWADEIKNDPELGGANFEKTRATCAKAMQAFADDDLRILFNESGIGNNPAVVKLFHNIGKGLQEDRLVMPGVDSRSGEPKRAADVLFPNL